MAKKFWKVANDIINQSDIILEILDARDISKTRNKEIEDKISIVNKYLIYVINKCDLVNKSDLEKESKKLKNSIFVSSTEYHGFKMLKERIIILGKKMNKLPVVGVVGYPNVGKSSVINALKGKHSAKTSSESGFTKGVQMISTKKFVLLDTPGVVSYKENDEIKLGSIGAIDFSKVKDPEDVAYELISKNKDFLISNYDLECEEEDFLESLAFKMNYLMKGGVPDIKRAARKLLQDWQKGKIKII